MMQAESIESRAVGTSSLRCLRGLLGLWAGLSLAALAGCGGAQPSDGESGVREDAICLPPCKPGPATLISGVTPTSIAVNDTNAYFTNAFSPINELDQVPIAGGAKTVLASSVTNMSSLVRSGTALFWADISTSSTDAGLWDMSLLSGGAPTQISHRKEDLISNQAVAVYTAGTTIFSRTTHVLFAVPLVAKLYDTRLSIFGTSEVSLLPDVDPVTMLNYYPFSLVIDATNVYFTHDSGGGLFRAPLSGGPATLLVGNVASTALALDGSTLFFQQGSDINQVAVTGGAVSTFAAGVGTVSAMVAHNGVVYWTCGSCGTVVKQAVGDTVRTVLASGQSNPRSLAVDDTHVYFGTSSALKRIAN